ncbi:MAG: DUF5666 domain-containing protein [Acidobacteriota bacterium]
MKTIKTILILSVFVLLSFCSTNEMDNTPHGIFTIHDSAVDSLSVLQVELTELKITDISGNETIVFTQSVNDTFVLNLLTLDGISSLIGSVPLAAGTYKEVTISFENAAAVDKFGNILTVVPKNYGSIKILLNPNVLVETENVFFDIDFDVNNSVYSVTTGKGGKVELHPVLVIKVDPEFSADPIEQGDEEENEIDDLKGIIESIDKMSMVVSFNGSTVNVSLSSTTIIEIDEFITTPPEIDNDITSVLFVGDSVEVDGPLDAGTNTVNATKVERKWGDPKGIEFQGIAFNIGSASFDVLVQNSENSAFVPGTVQTVNFNSNTLFLYTDPSAVTNSGHLDNGQDVRVTGDDSLGFTATRVKLRETKIKGTVSGYGSSSNQFYVKADTLEKMNPSSIPGFVNPVLVELKNFGTDVTISIGSKMEVEGQFNRASMGVYLAVEWEAEEEEDEEVEIESKDFSIASTSPLTIDAAGIFSDLGFTTTTTIQVLVGGSTSITKNEKGSKTSMTQQELIDGINDGLFDVLEAEGTFDNATNILTAKKVKVEVAEEEEEEEEEEDD